jgi:hypothetical protein
MNKCKPELRFTLTIKSNPEKHYVMQIVIITSQFDEKNKKIKMNDLPQRSAFRFLNQESTSTASGLSPSS